MAGGSGGSRAVGVRHQLTPGLTSSLRGTGGLPPSISFSTSYPEQIAVSDRGSLRGLTQFARSKSVELVEPAESKQVLRTHTRGTGVCDNL